MTPDFKRASWIELFYDVAFVALVAQLTYLAFEYHTTVNDLLNIFIIGYSIFIAWWATTANRNMQPTETALDKLLIQLQMVGAFLMSLTMADVFTGASFGFFATLAMVRLVQAFMMMRMYVMHAETRPKSFNILKGFLVGAGLWFMASVLPAPYQFVGALMALAVDIATPLTQGKGNTRRYLNVYHLQERLGLFLMLVIGESMIVVALSNTAGALTVVEPAVVLSGLCMMIALWWLYFEYSDLQQGVRPKNLFIFIHAHGFLFGSIILLSVGYKLAILNPRSLEALGFITAGSIGTAVALMFIRAMLNSTFIRCWKHTWGYVLCGAVIIAMGFTTEFVLESIVAFTILFTFAAYKDQRFTSRAIIADASMSPSTALNPETPNQSS